MSEPIMRLNRIMEEIGRVGLSESALDNARRESETLIAAINEIQAGEFSGADDSGGVIVEVDGRGTVKAINVTAKGMRDLDHKALGPAVVQAINDARRQSGEEVVQALRERLGIEMPDRPPTAPDMDEIMRLLDRRQPKG